MPDQISADFESGMTKIMENRSFYETIKSKKLPIRTCLGCGKKVFKVDMLRFVWHDSQLCYDSKGLINGRGFYGCDNESCLQAIIKNPKKVARALRCQAIKISGKLLRLPE